METVQQEGNREVKRMVVMYKLDAIIAVGYRVNSIRAAQFRQWATRAQRKNRVGDVHENGFHAASPAKERLDEGFISITAVVIASSTLSRKASGRRFFPFVTAFWGNLLDSLPRKG
ncbi:MAG: virulence RhuM family protein [Bacteroidales bacterium]|nr:virulence RhuM family protein [Bacteroidales bacterium]